MTPGQRMPLLSGGMFTRPEAPSLLRDDVHQGRTSQRTHRGERVDQCVDVVTVDRPEVAEAELLEQHAWREEGFHTLLPLPHQRAHGAGVVDDIADLGAYAIVERVALNRRQVFV